VTPAFGFSAEYRGDDPTYDGFDEYLRIEFGKRHPEWEPRFGRVSWFDRAANRYNYSYLLTGNVPEAESHSEAEKKVGDLLDELAGGLRELSRKAIPKPITRVWRRETK
jgi:hypothetical protein